MSVRVSFPKDLTVVSEAAKNGATVRAGGTDLQERRHMGIAAGDVVDVRDVSGRFRTAAKENGHLILGAGMTVQGVADHPDVQSGYPGLSQAAGGLATPQIRAVATLGGNLTQRVRCWYFRNPDGLECLKKGGSTCLAREGDHLYHACFERSPCAAVHPSTLGMALLAYEASVRVNGGNNRTVEALYGDGRDPRVENTLAPGEVLEAVDLPPPRSGEKAAYFRAIHRARAEWPLVETLARVVIEHDRIALVRVVIGGVANVPLRLTKVEERLQGKAVTHDLLHNAARLAASGAAPLPHTLYKVQLIPGTVLHALEQAVGMEAA